MYKTIKNVLETGRFELSDILTKIDTFWLKGSISDVEKSELTEIAQSKAKPENSVDFMKKIEELEQRVKALEENKASNDETTTDEYPEFVVGKWYYTDDKITFEGNKYKCIAPEGVTCVWSPKDYPVYWSIMNG
jgi:hypothetical protein